MKVKIYFDNTFNMQYEVGDYVKIQNNPKFGPENNDEGKWGEVISISGKPLTAKLTIETEDGEKIENYVWNVKPTNENGEILSDDQIFNYSTIVEKLDFELETINENNRTIIKFSDL